MTVRSSGRTGLSKSLILKGLQRQKVLWLAKNPSDFEFSEKLGEDSRLAAGIEVGCLARGLFPGGAMVPVGALSI